MRGGGGRVAKDGTGGEEVCVGWKVGDGGGKVGSDGMRSCRGGEGGVGK